MISFSFKKLSFHHLPLMHQWYNSPHVVKWYSKKKLDYKAFEKKYTQYISGELKIFGFVCYLGKKPIGYIQYYPALFHPPEGGLLKNLLSRTAGVDLFIGEKSFLGQGIGKLMLCRFLQKRVFPFFDRCIVDPDEANKRAIKAYEGCGFSIFEKSFSETGKPQLLMIKEKKVIS